MTTRQCINCGLCKRSARSKPNKPLAFCAARKKRREYPDDYWLTRQACRRFDNMVETAALMAQRYDPREYGINHS